MYFTLGKSKPRKKQLIVFIIIVLYITCFYHMLMADNTNQFILTATPNEMNNSVDLKWTSPKADTNYSYMIYQKHGDETDTSTAYQTIPATDIVHVLQVYPYTNQLVGWVKDYGQGKITCDAVSIEQFNKNPSIIWKYDVTVFGFWDCNNDKDLNPTSSSIVKQYIESGQGVLFGHDTITPFFTHPNFNSLSSYVNITLDGIHSKTGNTVSITKKGLLTNYPYLIGDVGKKLTIPESHVYGQNAHGDIWMRFTVDNEFYLTTWNNCAMIQTGHFTDDSNGSATPDEQRLLMNTIYYLAQKTTATHWEDHMGQDLVGPTLPEVSGVTPNYKDEAITINCLAEDRSDTYEYYIEAIHPTTGERLKSNVEKISYKTGLKGYSIVVDQNAATVPDNQIETSNGKYTVSIPDNLVNTRPIYIHIKALDQADNASEVLHYQWHYNDPYVPELKITGLKSTNDKISLMLNNIGEGNAKNICAQISCKEGLHLAKGVSKNIEIDSLGSGKGIEISWDLLTEAIMPDELYHYEVQITYAKKGKVATYTQTISFNNVFEEGLGTEEAPYLVSNKLQLAFIRYNLDAYYELTEDIDLEGMTWTPIGTYEATFTGHFKGNSKTISNFTINAPGESYLGFFGVTKDAYIEDVTLENVNIYGTDYVGSLIGYASGQNQVISNCFVNEGTIKGHNFVGGLIGYLANGEVSTCESLVEVEGNIHIGGLMGYGYGMLIKDCTSFATVTGAQDVGGLIGFSNGNRIETCHGIATVVGNENVGGLVGHSSGLKLMDTSFMPRIDTSESLGNIKGNSNAGGLVGYAYYDLIEGCTTSDNVEGNTNVGGLIGYSEASTVNECSSEAVVEGNTNTGELIGYAE